MSDTALPRASNSGSASPGFEGVQSHRSPGAGENQMHQSPSSSSDVVTMQDDSRDTRGSIGCSSRVRQDDAANASVTLPFGGPESYAAAPQASSVQFAGDAPQGLGLANNHQDHFTLNPVRQAERHLNVLLIGAMGSGKTGFGNNLLGLRAAVGDGPGSGTQAPIFHPEGLVQDDDGNSIGIAITDTVGLGEFGQARDMEQVFNELYMRMLDHQPHYDKVILFVKADKAMNESRIRRVISSAS
jgi:hypothetical protein